MSTIVSLMLKHDNYKHFIQEIVASKARNKAALAEAAGCHRSHLSRVLAGSQDLTPEQVEGIAVDLNLTELAAEYLHTMVALQRAGTPPLRKRLQSKLKSLKSALESPSGRIQESSSHQHEVYYSSWLYSAIHVLASIPSLATVQDLARALQLPSLIVNGYVSALTNMGYLKVDSSGNLTFTGHTHISGSSPLFVMHLANWRDQALIRSKHQNDDVFYTAIHSLSKNDLKILKSLILTFIEESSKRVHSSEEECAACLNIDLFKIV